MWISEVLLLIISVGIKNVVGQNDACRTPDGQTGICMIYINCDSIVRLLMVNAQQRDPNIEDYILQSICGNRQLSQMVCCPGLRFSHGITATSMTTRATTTVKTVTVRPTTAKITTAASSGGIFFFSDLSSAAPNPTTTTALPIPIPNGTYKLPRNSIDRCGMTNASHSRVVGGVDAQLGAWPWMAALGYRSSTYDLTTGPVFLCGGTLITIRHVLTAAHCIQNLLYFVRLGEYDITTTNDGANPVDIYVEKVIVHEQYNEKTIQNDVALIRLQSEAPFTDMIRPICMPVEEPMRSLNLTYYSPFVAGWGTTSFRGPTASRLQEVQVIVLPIDQCAFNYKLYFPDQVFDDKVLCAGFAQGGKDSCQGDSGGPLMLPQLSSNGQYYYFNLIGIVSYGYECAKAGFPGVYVKVSAYIPWIESKLNAWTAKTVAKRERISINGYKPTLWTTCQWIAVPATEPHVYQFTYRLPCLRRSELATFGPKRQVEKCPGTPGSVLTERCSQKERRNENGVAKSGLDELLTSNTKAGCSKAQSCYTPNGVIGVCQALPNCPSLVRRYQFDKSRQTVNFLISSQRNCGNRVLRGYPVLCCTDGVQYEPAPTTRSPFVEIPPTTPATTTTTSTTTTTTTTTTTPRPTQPPTTLAPLRLADCIGPDNKEGNCISLRDCPVMLNEFLQRQKDPQYIRFIQDSNAICNYIQPNVCCPLQSYTPAPPVPPPTVTPPAPPAPSTEGPTQPKNNGITTIPTPATGCGYSKVEHNRVVGGVPAALHGWPWMALVGYKDALGEVSFKCGGSLITNRHVLTAAHCIRKDLFSVRLGEHDTSIDTETNHIDVVVVKMETHPSYDKKDGHSDLAVLYLANDVAFNDAVRPICLPLSDPIRTRNFEGYTPFVAGWGRTQEGGKSANILQELQIPIISNGECRNLYAKINRAFSEKQFDDSVTCAGVLEGGKDSCQGDSGGPLMLPQRDGVDFYYYQVGVVSYGVGCARAEVPGVYTRVAKFVDWIQQKVNEPV
ncbi:uncharacterized protein LOC134222163 [Armigeres subalbatus]|uniref:uncharacterized protein LOC134222163 n=1 Tax=Armigeres subalbatus TaxID=124917 RepID=UPI002ED6A58D